MGAGEQMKVLFSLRHSFGIRNLEPVIRGLASRGHEVHVSLLSEDKSGTDQARALSESWPAITFGILRARKHLPWFAFARRVRVLVDSLRYRLPMYDRAAKLRARALRRLPAWQQRLVSLRIWRWSWGSRLFTRALLLLESGIPLDEVVLEDVRAHAPDLIVVSPLVDFGSDQVEYVKAGRQLGIPTALAVNSWDNLTNKGLMRVIPDRVYVWNETQRQEALDYHGASPELVEVTGAPTFDRWFGREPSVDAHAFSQRVGLEPDTPFVLYLCSSPFIAERELEFVERWILEIRAADDELLRGVGVLVRPHPENRQPWQRLRQAGDSNLAIWPPTGANPVDADTQDDYFHSMFHSRAVVGINSSGLIEAGIVGRPVLTILDPDLAATQEGTLHFHYLVDVGGGLLQVARTWDEHREHLRAALAREAQSRVPASGFVREFVRPLGLQVEAARVMTESLIDLSAMPRPAPREPGPLAKLLGMAMRPWAAGIPGRRTARGVRVAKGDRPSSDEAGGVDPEVERVRGAIQGLRESSAERILVGPWHGDVLYEVLYWIPFLRWAVEKGGLDPDRLVAITRGGAGPWYRDLAATDLEILDYLTPEELLASAQQEAPDGGGVQRSMTRVDREIVRIAKQSLGARRVKVLHPSVMARSFAPYWAGGSSLATVRELTVHRRLPLPDSSRAGFRLPEEHVTLRVSFGESYPDTAENRSALTDLVDMLTARWAVVLLGPSRVLIDQLDLAGDRGRLLDGGAPPWPQQELAHAAAVIARSRALVSTGDGLSFLAPLYGVDSLMIRSESTSHDSPHVELARRELEDLEGAGSLTWLRPPYLRQLERIPSVRPSA